ncbi:MAG: tRNA uridine-5-carboxymethylaminomethyl(34) synthesis enzyme MnmG [Phycisphaeraceae bacterium]|nr:tRNA uridine-5-carboxymethylaminomethyl(34) synthesis enzyme MnmG [Phycisphaeraceae bacterium]
MPAQDVDIVVIGGGHAGSEAAWACANLGVRVAMITMEVNKIGAMSCNPAIGGLAKGQIVREIDALGGLMGIAADNTGIQFRILNASKGPAVRGPRCQSDKYAYAREVQRLLKTRSNIQLIQGVVDDILVEDGKTHGVVYSNPQQGINHQTLNAAAVILTTGTFMRGLMHTGEAKTQGGRVDEGSAEGISGNLTKLGLELGRLKTGTPPRLAAESINFDILKEQPGDEQPQPFSDMTGIASFPPQKQVCCWITETCADSHEHIKANLDRAPLFNGQIEKGSVGPRYCPSIEDKVMRFADRQSHHVFLEPESLETNEIYCNGISTSLPRDVQDVIVHNLPGCENARILKYGYAVEYDMVWPHQIDATCMTKSIHGLFLAGQINGTSGYEEAAGQGLIAGLNAVRYMQGKDEIRFGRDQCYLGVMMDDLITKTPREPYRMFTSRAEFRLQLRSDNAADRLTPIGRDLGLVDDARWEHFEHRKQTVDAINQTLIKTAYQGMRLIDWCKRPEVNRQWLTDRVTGPEGEIFSRYPMLLDHVLAQVMYDGYLDRQARDIERLRQQEKVQLPEHFDYNAVVGLRNESKAVLDKFRPRTMGQASRLAGITPADLMVLSVALGRR